MTEKKKLSTAEILAAARKDKAAGGAPPPAAEAPAAAEAAAPAESAATEPASTAPQPAAKPGERPSVKDILAAARGGGKPAGAAPAKPAEPKSAAPKPASAKPTAAAGDKAKPAAKPAGAGAVRDTASILAAARGAAKPGPITKAEAAAKPKEEEPAKAKGSAAPPMPPKPASVERKPAKAAESNRRGFFELMVGSFLGLGFTSLALTNALWGLGLARFMFPNILTEPPSRFKVGFPADFAPGMVESKFVAQFGVWVCNVEYQGQQQIVALRTVCTHLGCTPNWLEAEQKFKCPCHGSGFYKDGINFEGPAPRPLERYSIRLADDGQVEIDKSKLYQEEMGQWADASCFIKV